MTHTPHFRPLLATLALLLLAAATGCADHHNDPNVPADTGLPVDFSSIRIAAANGTGGSTGSVPTTDVGRFYKGDVIHARLTHDGSTQEALLTNIGSNNAPVWQADNTIYWQSTDPATKQTLTLSRGPEGDFTLPDNMEEETFLYVPSGMISIPNYALHDRLFHSYTGPMPATPIAWELQHCMAQIVVTLTRDEGSPLPTNEDLRKARVSMTLPAEGHFDGVSGEVTHRRAGAGGTAGAKPVKFFKSTVLAGVPPHFAVALPGNTGTRVITITIPKDKSTIGTEQTYQYTAPADITLEAGRSRVFRLSLGTRVSALSISTKEWQAAEQGPGVSEGLRIIGVTPGKLASLLPTATFDYGHISVSGELNGDDYRALKDFLNGLPAPVSLEIEITGGGGEILMQAFMDCQNLGAVVLKGIKVIEDNAFMDSSLTSITLPEGLTDINNFAFLNCEGLKSITLPSSVTDLGNQAFAGCTNLASVSLPEGLQTIKSNVFSGCTSLTSITLPASVTTLGTAIFSRSGLTSIALPEGMEEIPHGTFQDCKGLQTITLPSTITDVGDYAFYGSGLISIILPMELDRIGEEAFADCTALQKVAAYEAPTISVGADAFKGTHDTKQLFDYSDYYAANPDVTIPLPLGTTWQTLYYGYKGSGDKLDPDSYTYQYYY